MNLHVWSSIILALASRQKHAHEASPNSFPSDLQHPPTTTPGSIGVAEIRGGNTTPADSTIDLDKIRAAGF